jgi:GNAT superfamily N-acetyltransferase
MLTFTRSDLEIRPAQPGDRAGLEAIAAQVWDGNDYLPRVMDSWFADPHDGFFVAAVRGSVIGVVKLTRFAEGEWWLEGLRVAPDFRGQGLSRILHHFVMNRLRQIGSGVVRLSTGADNDAVHTLAHETAFERVACYALLAADPLDEPVEALRPVPPGEAARVWTWLSESDFFQQAQRSIEWDWSFYFLTEARLAERLDAGLVYGWYPGGADRPLAGLLIVNPSENDRFPGGALFKVAYLDVPPDSLTAAARDVRRLAASLDRIRVRIKMLDGAGRAEALEQAGYIREWENAAACLYTREVSLTQHAAVRTEDLPPLDAPDKE